MGATARPGRERTVPGMPSSSDTTLTDRACALAAGFTPLDPPQGSAAIPLSLRDLLCVETLRALTNQRSWARGVGLLDDCERAPEWDQRTEPSLATSVVCLVPGSGARSYEVTLRRARLKTRDRYVLAAECTCPANVAPRGCKHVVLFGLLLLGYTPADTDREAVSPLSPAPVEPLPATPSLRSLLDALSDTAVRDLLAEVAASHPDVHDLALHACASAAGALPARDWAAAVEQQAQRALSGLDWGREWKYAGGRAAGALSDFYNQWTRTSASEHASIAIAVLRGALSVATGDAGDRYGDCEALALRLLDDLTGLAAAGRVTDDHRAELAGVVCLLAGAEVGYGDLKAVTARRTIARLLGRPGAARLADRSAAAQHSVSQLTAALTTARGAVVATRQAQLDDARGTAAALEELRSQLSFA